MPWWHWRRAAPCSAARCCLAPVIVHMLVSACQPRPDFEASSPTICRSSPRRCARASRSSGRLPWPSRTLAARQARAAPRGHRRAPRRAARRGSRPQRGGCAARSWIRRPRRDTPARDGREHGRGDRPHHQTIRERAELKRLVRRLTAQGRLGGGIVSAIPVASPRCSWSPGPATSIRSSRARSAWSASRPPWRWLPPGGSSSARSSTSRFSQT